MKGIKISSLSLAFIHKQLVEKTNKIEKKKNNGESCCCKFLTHKIRFSFCPRWLTKKRVYSDKITFLKLFEYRQTEFSRLFDIQLQLKPKSNNKRKQQQSLRLEK